MKYHNVVYIRTAWKSVLNLGMKVIGSCEDVANIYFIEEEVQ